ncbi:hypothetical protein BGW80DRAFT_390693 [Lactifluus volemus]|nr:hypothetical protein BGW80DRAFT_390693 [Lactifluus volemus]
MISLWVSTTVTVDFDPTNSERARAAGIAGPGISCYPGQLRDLDLLVGGGGNSSTRKLTAPSGHSLGPPEGLNAILGPHNGSGSAASSSEGGKYPSSDGTRASSACIFCSPVRTVTLTSLPLSFHLPRHANTVAATAAHLANVTIAIAITLTSAQWGRREVVAAIVTVSIAIDIALASAEWCRRAGIAGQSDFSRQPYLYMVAIPPGYLPSQVDPSRPMLMHPV